MLNVGVDVLSGSKIADKYPGGDGATDGAGCTYINFGVGYGFGIRPIRHVELMPFVMAVGDYMINNNDLVKNEDLEENVSKQMAW